MEKPEIIVCFGVVPSIVICAIVGYVLLRYILVSFPILIVIAIIVMLYFKLRPEEVKKHADHERSRQEE